MSIELQPKSSRCPVLFSSSAVGVSGAAQLATYAAKARGLEALCAVEAKRLQQRRMDVGCVAAEAAERTPGAHGAGGTGRVVGELSDLGLDGIAWWRNYRRAMFYYQAPRFTVLMVGLDGHHARFRALTGSGGCLSLPLSLFYDEPTVLDAAQWLHRSGSADSGAAPSDGLEQLLRDPDARRSYELSQAKGALNAKDTTRGGLSGGGWWWWLDFQVARERCRAAASGATGHALMAAQMVEAEACKELGLTEDAVELLTAVLGASPTSPTHLHHPTHHAPALVVPLLGSWEAHLGLVLGKLGLLGSSRGAFDLKRRAFLGAVAWVEAAGGSLTTTGTAKPLEFLEAGRLKWLNLDDQKLHGNLAANGRRDQRQLQLDDEALIIPKLSILRARGCDASTFPRLTLGMSKGGNHMNHGPSSNLNTVFWANNGLSHLDVAAMADVFGSLRLSLGGSWARRPPGD
eukprot:Skav236624  [mRNA]  locus=scaffold182:41216:52452:+ [translate_table: standard]